ncbi:hypothetical protein [Paenibacillus sp. JNUCC32]|uniref:hypothetical protein n=1 Tax=Paenibacillus sp. JNUCC32 TaxID=2777984 RepID=UPI001E483FB7|nr:hypothetical protein [Paenibacillus sp. JNUCC-32]
MAAFNSGHLSSNAHTHTSAKYEKFVTGQDQHIERTGSLGLSVDHALGRSAIYGLKGYERVEMVYPNANTNVLYPRTVLPTQQADLEPGSHLLLSAVCGETASSKAVHSPEEALRKLGIALTQDGISISKGRSGNRYSVHFGQLFHGIGRLNK